MDCSPKKLVRVDVDTQNGFCSKKGGLYVTGAEKVIPLVSELNRECADAGYALIGSVDTHTPKDPEFDKNGGRWPIHCVQGTKDWLKVPATLPEDFQFISKNSDLGLRELKRFVEERKGLYFEKASYSLFTHPLAETLVTAYANDGYVFEVYGVATDYCVKEAALAIRNCAATKPVVRVLLKACAGVTPETTQAAVEAMKAAGVEIVE
jgi:nicotinamidase/pyrazinamidase